MIIRKNYLDQIRPFINKPLIKAITGVRRCGKSTLLRQIISLLEEKGIQSQRIIYINKELLEFDNIRTYKDLHTHIHSKTKKIRGKFYIFLDEVQEIMDWEKALASLLAEGHFDLYVTGSNAKLLSSELASLLTGRFVEIKMYPFNFDEFLESYLSDNRGQNENEAFELFLKIGGFPGLHSLQWDDQPVRQFLESIYSTILLREIVLRYTVRDVYMLEKISEFLISNCGNITSANKISAFLKSQKRSLSVDTVQNYITYTRNAYLMHQLKRYDLTGKKLLETQEKYYACDVGLRYALLGYTPEILPGNLENIVLIGLLSKGYRVYVGKMQTYEIDFIAEKGNEKLYLQICTRLTEGSTIDREYRALEAIDDHFPKYVLSLDSGFETSRKGIRWMNIRDFLKH